MSEEKELFMEGEKKERFKKFTQGYTFKIFLLGFLILLLLFPLSMIRGLIGERNRTANSAEAGIMEAWGSELIVAGPLIAIPGVRTEERRVRSERDGERIEIFSVPFTLIITPQKLDIGADFKTEIRRRGIFSVPLFYGDLALSGIFNPAAALSSLLPNEEVSLNQAELVITLSSQKGIRKIEKALWSGADNRSLFFQPGSSGINIARFANPNSVSSRSFQTQGR
jgi:inner membrane protein